MLKKAKGFLLDIAQKYINRMYEKEGLTDKVLDAQILLNSQRNKYNIPDENEIVTSDGFTQ